MHWNLMNSVTFKRSPLKPINQLKYKQYSIHEKKHDDSKDAHLNFLKTPEVVCLLKKKHLVLHWIFLYTNLEDNT